VSRRQPRLRLTDKASPNNSASDSSAEHPRAVVSAAIEGLLLGFVLYLVLEVSASGGPADPSSTGSFADRLVISGVAAVSLTAILLLIGTPRITSGLARLALGGLATSVTLSLLTAAMVDALVFHFGVVSLSPELVVGGMIAFSTICLSRLLLSPEEATRPLPVGDPRVLDHVLPAKTRSSGPVDEATTFAATRSTRSVVAHEPGEAEDLSTLPTPHHRVGYGTVHLVPVEIEQELELEDPIWISAGLDRPRPTRRTFRRQVKRALDIVVASTSLVLLSPLLATLAILIKLESRGPALYVQTRVSLNGKTFNLLKFRSMRCDAEHCTGPVFATRNDPRCTRIGRFMRRHSLDELPQLINVVTGDMSIVGPRPERPYFVVRFSQTIPHYAERHREKAGITGWAQVNGRRGDTSIEERVQYDLHYVENWSLMFDLKIMVRTVVEILRGHNAY